MRYVFELKNAFVRVLHPSKYCYRLRSTTRADKTYSVPESSELSTRQIAWKSAQLKYSNYENILYSSYLESQLEPANRWRNGNSTRYKIYPPLEELADFNSVNVIGKKQKNVEFPQNWMEDYEFYEATLNKTGSPDGTPDTTIPFSQVPCNGCGSLLHCSNRSWPGYIPSEIFKGRTKVELSTITCQRCHFLKNYNIALDIEVTPKFYEETISRIMDKFALAVIIVDLLDFPCSIWPNMQQVLGSKRPVFIVGNKVDLLPRDSNRYLDHVKHCLKQQFINHGGFDAMNIKHVSLISAKTGYGIEELITQLHNVWKHKGDVYLMGCTNVGKSTLFNILLNSDYCRPEAVDLVRKATTSPWPGTTLQMLKFPILRPSDIRVFQRFQRLVSERGIRSAEDRLRRDQAKKFGSIRAAQLIGNVGRTFEYRTDSSDNFALSAGTQPITTLNEQREEFRQAKWCYDTPGVMHPDQITNLLTTDELLRLQSPKMISPRAYRLEPNMSLFLAGLGRLDFLSATSMNDPVEWIKVFVFASIKLPVVITYTKHASDIYKRYLGTELLGVPGVSTDDKRLIRWPGLQRKTEPIKVNGRQLNTNDQKTMYREEELSCDITLSSAGWIGLILPRNSECNFHAWTPHALGVYVRNPPLIPLSTRLVGKRIRNSLAYNMSQPFVFRK